MQFKSGNTSLVRSLNKQHVLNFVRLKSGIAAREIGQETNLQMSTVLYTLRSLQEEGLVKQTGHGVVSNIVQDIPIKFSGYGSYSGAVGVTALIYRNIFSQN